MIWPNRVFAIYTDIIVNKVLHSQIQFSNKLS